MTRAEKRAANKAAHVNLGRGHNKGSGKPASGFPAMGSLGGPARGRRCGPGPGRPKGVKNGEGKKALAAAALEAAAPEAAQALIAIMRDLSDPRALMAANSILNKTGLHDKHGVEVGGAGGGPLKVTVEIVDAFEAGSEAATSPAGIE